MAQGPDFKQKTKETLAKRAGQTCSNPDCRKNTSAPHTDNDKSINLGEAAHIKAARNGQARYDTDMTDDERSDISNGIWLCKECARKIDLDESKYSVELLYNWKKEHEEFIASGKKKETPLREIEVSDNGIGSIIENTDIGVGLDITHSGKDPAERITVKGKGIGEIITNTGSGIGKRIVATGNGPASESNVVVNKPVQMAVGMSVTVISMSCSKCGKTSV